MNERLAALHAYADQHRHARDEGRREIIARPLRGIDDMVSAGGFAGFPVGIGNRDQSGPGKNSNVRDGDSARKMTDYACLAAWVVLGLGIGRALVTLL